MTEHDTSSKEHLWKLIADMRFGMLTTRHGNGHLHSRPMTTQNCDDDEDAVLWFFAGRDSETVKDIAADPSVAMIYADPGEDCYVSVSGTCRAVDDMPKKRELWSTMTEAWFPGGVEDPASVLLRLDISHADYWDVDANKLVQLFRMATASVTGKPPQDMGEHRRIDM